MVILTRKEKGIRVGWVTKGYINKKGIWVDPNGLQVLSRYENVPSRGKTHVNVGRWEGIHSVGGGQG